MIDDFNYIDYYPIDFKIDRGRLVSNAETYNCNGDEFSLCVNAPISKSGFKESSRILRAWLRGTPVLIGGDIYQLKDSDAILQHPLAA